MLALAMLSLCGAVWTGRYDSHASNFLAGFFLGVALAVCVGYVVIPSLHRGYS
jgi:hypothetical protein